MHEELFSQLLYMAKQSNITITEVAGGDNDPDIAFCKERIININRNYKSNISLVIRLAHEITHITFSRPSFLYTFSPYIKNKEERITNERAIRIVAKLGADVKIMDRFFRHQEVPDSENFPKPGFQLKPVLFLGVCVGGTGPIPADERKQVV